MCVFPFLLFIFSVRCLELSQTPTFPFRRKKQTFGSSSRFCRRETGETGERDGRREEESQTADERRRKGGEGEGRERNEKIPNSPRHFSFALSSPRTRRRRPFGKRNAATKTKLSPLSFPPSVSRSQSRTFSSLSLCFCFSFIYVGGNRITPSKVWMEPRFLLLLLLRGLEWVGGGNFSPI